MIKKQTEQQLQKQILNYLKAKGYYAIKVITANRAGCPDILACIQGRFVGIEVKVGRNKASELQLSHMRAIDKAGGLAALVYSLKAVKELCESLEQGTDS